MTQGFSTTPAETSGTTTDSDSDSNTTDALPDMPSGDGDGDPGDGDGDPNPTTTGDGDGDPPGDGDPSAECGNGIIDDGEQCDGGNLGGFTCVDLGYDGGTLACDMITCTFDASGCTTDMGGTGGTTG